MMFVESVIEWVTNSVKEDMERFMREWTINAHNRKRYKYSMYYDSLMSNIEKFHIKVILNSMFGILSDIRPHYISKNEVLKYRIKIRLKYWYRKDL